ncbi:MAG: hypothetical protein AAFQ61_11300 [Cyanobacteria bacterium J06626_23]
MGFRFQSDEDGVMLWFRDWQNRHIVLRFGMVYAFEYRLVDECYGRCGGETIEVIESERIASMRREGALTDRENPHHYIVSTNEGEWCEVVAEGVEIQQTDRLDNSA